jgi:hypothetical protein
MWFLSWSSNRQSFRSGGRRRAQGTRSSVLAAAVNLSWRVGTAMAILTPILGLILARPIAPGPDVDGSARQAPDAEVPPGSGIVLRTEITTIWIPRALRDLALCDARPPLDRSPVELLTCLKQNVWIPDWYALTYRGHQVNHGFADITLIRRLSEAANHVEELQAVMATAAGRPPRREARDFSRARVKVVPDTMQAMDPREAIARLMAEPVVGNSQRSDSRS